MGIELSGADIIRAYKAFKGEDDKGQRVAEPLRRRRRGSSLWRAWAARAERALEAATRPVETTYLEMVEELNQDIAEAEKRRTKENSQAIQDEIQQLRKTFNAEAKKLEMEPHPVSIEICPYSLKGVDLAPGELADLLPLLPEKIRGIDDVESDESDDPA